MINHEKYTELLQWHKGVEEFDYNQAIDWAVDLLNKGIETENILIIASFSKPVNREEIKPYITGVLQDLNLEEKYGEYTLKAHAHFYIDQIINDYEVRKSLEKLYKLCLAFDYQSSIYVFYNLYHAWGELESEGYNYYYEGATLENIKELLQKEAKDWVKKYIDNKEPLDIEIVDTTIEEEKKDNIENKSKSFWSRVKQLLRKF